MADSTTAPLILDFLDWLARQPRPYAEVMETWRTSCPRLTVWEDAIDEGLAVRTRQAAGETVVTATALGLRRLAEAGRTGAADFRRERP